MRKMFAAVTTALVALAAAGAATPATAMPSTSSTTPHHGAGLAAPTSAARPPLRYSATPAVLPSSVDLTQWAVPAGDQGQVDSCTSWSVGYTLTGWWASRAGVPTAFAPMYVYSQTHLSQSAGGGGAYLADAFGITSSQGIDTRAHYSHSGTDFSLTPNAAETANAANFRMQPMRRLYAGYSGTASSTAQQQIKSSLAAGDPVVLGIPIYDGFYSLDADDHRFAAMDARGSLEGYHAVVVLGYDASGVTIENSWGDSWGDHGFAQLDWDFVTGYSTEADTTSGLVASPPDTGVASWPTAVSTSTAANTATISWQPPVVSGGVPISGYRVTRDSQDLAWSGAKTVDVSASTRSFTFSNLYPSASYTLTVQPLTAAAAGETTSVAVRTAAAVVPGAPTDVRSVPDPTGRSTGFTWSAPAESGGWPVWQYRVVLSGGATTRSWSTGDTSTSVNATDVRPGTAYTIAISAVNQVGEGPAVTAGFTTTDVPAAPTITGTTSTTTSATVTWTPGAGLVTGYRISTGSAGVVDLPADARSYTLHDLSGGADYPFSVVAMNGAGASAPAIGTVSTAPWPRVEQPTPTALPLPTSTTTMPARPIATPSDPATPSIPARPGSVSARPIGSAVVVRWTAPVDDGGEPVARWRVAVGSVVVVVRDPSARTAVVEGARRRERLGRRGELGGSERSGDGIDERARPRRPGEAEGGLRRARRRAPMGVPGARSSARDRVPDHALRPRPARPSIQGAHARGRLAVVPLRRPAPPSGVHDHDPCGERQGARSAGRPARPDALDARPAGRD